MTAQIRLDEARAAMHKFWARQFPGMTGYWIDRDEAIAALESLRPAPVVDASRVPTPQFPPCAVCGQRRGVCGASTMPDHLYIPCTCGPKLDNACEYHDFPTPAASPTPEAAVSKYYCSQCAASWEGVGVPNTCPECLMPAATIEGLRDELRITHEKLHAVERMWQRDRATPEAGSPAEDDAKLIERLEEWGKATLQSWRDQQAMSDEQSITDATDAFGDLTCALAARLRARPQQEG